MVEVPNWSNVDGCGNGVLLHPVTGRTGKLPGCGSFLGTSCRDPDTPPSGIDSRNVSDVSGWNIWAERKDANPRKELPEEDRERRTVSSLHLHQALSSSTFRAHLHLRLRHLGEQLVRRRELNP